MSETPQAKDRDLIPMEGHPTDYQTKAAVAHFRGWA
jgi:hypothetical protein